MSYINAMGIARYEKRVIAWILDKILSWAFGIAILVILLHFGAMDRSIFLCFLVSILLSYGCYIVVNGASLHLTQSHSFGMWIMRIKMVHPDGGRLSFYECYLKSIMGGLLPFAMVNAAFMLTNHTERSAFDRLSETVMVDPHR